MPLEDYDAVREYVEMYESENYRKEITKAREEIKKGRVVTHEDLKRKLAL